MRRLCVLLLLLGVGPAHAEDERARPFEAAAEVAATIGARDPTATTTAGALAWATSAEELSLARAKLIALGNAGLRASIVMLPTMIDQPEKLDALLHVIAVGEHPASDVILAEAATLPEARTRMIAADGLAAGRTPSAVPALAALAIDPVPGVRAAALRALFAIDTEEAAKARHALPLDARGDLATRRLRWHRTRWSVHDVVGIPVLLPLAEQAWREGRTPAERMAASMLIASGRLDAPPALLSQVLDELGTDEVGAAGVRMALGVALEGYDNVTMRKGAILAGWAAMRRADAAGRSDLLDRAVGWLAIPVKSDPFDPRPVPETILRMVLPDFGEAIVEPVMKRLRSGAFEDPQDGVFLLTEALEPDRAAELLGGILEAKPPFGSGVRVAAADGLLTIRRVGDEARARWLLREEERPSIRRDVVLALAEEERPYAVGLLEELTTHPDEDLSDAAVQALERRTDDAARRVLVDHLFRDAPHPHQRLEHLVEPGDDLAMEVVERALGQDRISLRLAALERLARARNLQGEKGRQLVLDYELRAKGTNARTHEYEQVLYAMMAQAPKESLELVRTAWPEFEKLRWIHTPLKLLRHLHGEDVSPGVVDLVLEKIGWDGEAPHAPPFVLVHAATALEARKGHRDDEVDDLWRVFLGHEDQGLVMASIRSLRHPGRGDLTDLLVPLLRGLDVANPECATDGTELVEALEHQPFDEVATALIDLVLDPNAEAGLRRRAARSLVGKITERDRRVLLGWLIAAQDTGADLTVQRAIARVVGTGAGKDIAAQLADAIESDLRKHFEGEESLDPDSPLEPGLGEHLSALARTAAFTEDHEALTRIVGLIFLPRFATYARRSVERQETEMGPSDASAAARLGPDVNVRWHRAGGPYAGLPPEVWWIIDALKVIPDGLLARSFASAVEDELMVAAFPDLYLDRIIALLHDKRTGDREETAGVLEALAWTAEPVGGAVDFGIARDHVDRGTWSRRFKDAAAAQERLLGMLARRAYDDDVTWTWRRQRGILRALQGAAAAGTGDDPDAHFKAAERTDPYDSEILTTIATLRAHLGLDLDDALRLARRAATLERRRSPRGEATAATGTVLGLVRLARGEAREAADLLSMVAREVELRQPFRGGRYHLLLAQALLAAGYPRDAGLALLKALQLEPSLEGEISEHEAFAAWRQSGALARILKQAREAYWVSLEED